MGDKTGIEWTDATWNPVTGCTKVSQGCKNCYAKHQAWPRLKASPGTVYFGREFEEVAMHESRLDQPMRWTKPRRIFVNSMSDLFHEDIPFEFIVAVFGAMAASMQHKFQVLTKRPQRMLEWSRWIDERGGLGPFIRSIRVDGDRTIPNFFASIARTEVIHGKTVRSLSDPWFSVFNAAACIGSSILSNVWLGVSVEDQETADERIPWLLQVPAAVHWISAEPLLAPIDIRQWLPGTRVADFNIPPSLDWVVVGGESGPGARPMNPGWPRSLRDQCFAADVPFLFKQWGEYAPNNRTFAEVEHSTRKLTPVAYDGPGTVLAVMDRVGKKAAGRALDGREWNEYPAP